MYIRIAFVIFSLLLPLAAIAHGPTLPGYPKIDNGVEDFNKFWRRYLDGDAYAAAVSWQGAALLFETLPEPDSAACDRGLEEVERLLLEHPPYPRLHDWARRCHLLRGANSDAEVHQQYIAAFTAVMQKDGDGSGVNAPLWAATPQDARFYVESSGARVIDVQYRIDNVHNRLLYLLYTEDAGREVVRYFIGDDIVFSIMKAHQRLASGGSKLTERAWQKAFGGVSALLWLAANKDPAAAKFLGDVFSHHGLSNTDNLRSALWAYLIAAKNNSAIGADKFAQTVFRFARQDLYEDAVKYLHLAIEKNYCPGVITLLQIAELKKVRQSKLPDLSEARRRCTLKMPGGEFEHKIAESYSMASGELHDKEKAFFYWQQAANKEYVDSRLQLAHAHIKGVGTARNVAAGLKLLHELIATGNLYAAVDFGYFLSDYPDFWKQYGPPVKFHRLAAYSGEKVAQYNLALALYYGQDGAAVDIGQAVEWFRKSAAQGYASAQRVLGRHLLENAKDDQVLAEALEMLQAAAGQGDAPAQNILGTLYETGRGVAADLSRARYWYQKALERSAAARINYYLIGFHKNGPFIDNSQLPSQLVGRAKSGDPEALTALHVYAGKYKVQSEAAEIAKSALKKAVAFDYAPAYYVHDLDAIWFKTLAADQAANRHLKNMLHAAELGYSYAHLILGDYYYNLSKNKNDDNASMSFRHILAAAEMGINEAIYKLAQRYEYGIGTAVDMAAAYHWYRKAADNGIAVAENALAALTLTGAGTEKNIAIALEWLNKAAADGVVLAMRNLGHLYRDGKVVERNLETALDWYLKASEKGDQTADIKLAEMLMVEPEFGQNASLARIYLNDAVESGNADAMFWLARSYEIEADETVGTDKIEEIYRYAADQGHAMALNNLAIRYLKTDDQALHRKAWRMLERAAHDGNRVVLANLAFCYENGVGVGKDLERALELYRESAGDGSPFALKRLSELYSAPNSKFYDPERAGEYLRRLSDALLNYSTLISTSSLIDPFEGNDGKAFELIEPGVT